MPNLPNSNMKNAPERTAPLEVFFIDPELSEGIQAYEDEAFTWTTKGGGDDELKRLNYIKPEEFKIDILMAKVKKYQDAGLGITVLTDYMDSPLVRLFAEVSNDLTTPLKLIDWESYDNDLMNYIDFPQSELFHDDYMISITDKRVQASFVDALNTWLPENMDMTTKEIETLIKQVEDVKEPVSDADVTLENYNDEVPADFPTHLAEYAGQESLFINGITDCSDGSINIWPKDYKKGTDQYIYYVGEVERNNKKKPPLFTIRAQPKTPSIMENVILRVELKKQGNISEKREVILSDGDGNNVYFGSMEIEESMEIINFEIIERRG